MPSDNWHQCNECLRPIVSVAKICIACRHKRVNENRCIGCGRPFSAIQRHNSTHFCGCCEYWRDIKVSVRWTGDHWLCHFTRGLKPNAHVSEDGIILNQNEFSSVDLPHVKEILRCALGDSGNLALGQICETYKGCKIFDYNHYFLVQLLDLHCYSLAEARKIIDCM